MKIIVSYLLIIVSCYFSYSQDSLSELLQHYNTRSVPYISVEELAIPKTKAILLDAREISEYQVSHLKNAKHVGYDNFDIAQTTKQLKDKDQLIVVYCSLGIRSEDIAQKLDSAGYTNVKNLYGGIFEWKNKNFSVFDTTDKETDKVHVFSKEWGKWLLKGKKVYD